MTVVGEGESPVFRIASGDNSLEVTVERGEARVAFRHGAAGRAERDGGDLCFDAPLSRMLAVSTGRPWRIALPGAREPEVRRTPQGLAVRCAVGGLAAEVAFAFVRGLLRLDVTWRNTGERGYEDVVLGVALPLPCRKASAVTLPQVLYRGNPSADPDRTVPRLGVGPHRALVVEEHRLPVPCAHAEWRSRGRVPTWYATLYAAEPGEGSLGAVQRGHVTLLAMSGALMFNGVPDTAYVHKGKTAPYDGGYLDLPPGAVHRAHYALDWGVAAHPGHGFRPLVHQGLGLYAPEGARPLTLDRIVHYKTAAMDRRWHEAGGAAGFLKFTGPGHTPGFLYGWTGQSLKLAWCDARVGLERDQPWRVDRCRRAVDFYLDGSAAGAPPGLRMSFYSTEDRAWSAFERDGETFISSRAYGDALCDLADVIELLGAHGHAVPRRWIRALAEGADTACATTASATVPPLGWRLDGSPLPQEPGAAGLACVLALLKAHRITGEAHMLRRGEQLVAHYRHRHADDWAKPFARATLDAVCEDKEGGIAYFLCVYELLLLAGGERRRAWAEEAADWLLTWVYQWDPPFESGFRTAGWPGVSVQNHHVDVFFPAYELARLGELTGREMYRRLGELILYAFGQGICTKAGEWGFEGLGEQAEGFFPTNWQARGTSNTWNPSWVTAQVLSQALRMRAAGQPSPWRAGSGRCTPRGR
ncbi:hypothetical protein ACH4S9_27495 [Streptomyces sp. NPDC021225]|uniref:hypothetical protein n=1 Tax=Streptomyces sp. NPDC021225 TaxID=3365121 RepID=UPI0037AC4ADF